MMKTKILFSDLDDTLLDVDKNVSAEDLSSIHEMIKAGHRFVIATGRPVYSAKVVAKRLNLYRDGIYLVASNGGMIYDCGREDFVSRVTVDPDLTGRMFDIAVSEGLHIHTYTDTHVVSVRETEEIKIYSQKISMPYRIVDKIPDDLPSPPPKFVVMSIKEGSRRILEDFRDRHLDLTEGKCQNVFSNDFLLEYLPLGVSKGIALRTLCDLLDIPVEASYAAGDEANDIPMLDAAGLGIAVHNATDEAKSHAGYVTRRTNNESAISEIIRKFILT